MKINISNLAEIAIKAALDASFTILEIYESENFEVETKSDNSPLTRADNKAHEIINKHLIKSEIPILSEEGKEFSYLNRNGWNTLWIVDPIDGTKEFIKKNGEFTINIALIHNGSPILGVVYVPVSGDLYYAENKIGSYKYEKIKLFTDLNSISPINLKESVCPNIYTIVVSKSHMNKETQKFVDLNKEKYVNIITKSFGSSLKICKVAEGKAHCYPRFGPTMEWDTAAAHAIAKYAGCTVTKTDSNSTLSYNKEDLLNPFFIVRKS